MRDWLRRLWHRAIATHHGDRARYHAHLRDQALRALERIEIQRLLKSKTPAPARFLRSHPWPAPRPQPRPRPRRPFKGVS